MNGPGELSLRTEYEEQMSRTTQAAQAFKQQLDVLMEEHGKLDPEDPSLDADTVAALKKLQFMTVQQTSAEAMLMSIESQFSTWRVKFFLQKRTREQEIAQNRFYMEAAHLLRVMEVSFRNVVFVPPSTFGEAFDAWKSILTEHPGLCVGATVAMGGVGAFFGAGLHGLLGFKHGILHLGLHAKLAEFGTVGGVVIGGAGGAVVGVVSVAVLLGFVVFLQRGCRKLANDERALRNMVESRMKELAAKSLDDEAILALANLYHDCFVRPVEAVLNGENCLICLEGFELEAPRERRAITAVCCRAKHFVHERCNFEWLRRSKDVRCVYCRQQG